ncbi:hypothetical protein CFHF_22430 [Caulobacter flavus]|uniref:Uncharacterized protein n=1 Tax=Caulobacter flavus TaxID=1679497 RepID=A0A2N5CMN8_9CAUL|nr:hypothetical protein [Caulobacter flavus]AYV47089.1 hypothetical protein C1707_12920 [Caulobacter flavus]PLR07393.1 hypothetical protein CFHF_22430 [Caulobacter flavus]
MAKTVYQRNQKVWVESVGAWATIEKIVPIWAKGFDEPVRVTYDVGLGREFLAHELKPEDRMDPQEGGALSNWRILRARNKWQQESDCLHHPFPGTYPVVVTDPNDWGGWRTPGAEYDRDPRKIEFQAKLIAASPRLHALAREIMTLVGDHPEDAPPALLALAQKAAAIERELHETPAAAGTVEG